jgi:hypothetical protein
MKKRKKVLVAFFFFVVSQGICEICQNMPEGEFIIKTMPSGD